MNDRSEGATQCENDKKTQDLRLIFEKSRSSGIRNRDVKRLKVLGD